MGGLGGKPFDFHSCSIGCELWLVVDIRLARNIRKIRDLFRVRPGGGGPFDRGGFVDGDSRREFAGIAIRWDLECAFPGDQVE